MAKTVLITRFKLDDKKDIIPFREWVSVFTESEEIDRVYIICKENDVKNLKKMKFMELKNKNKILFRPHDEPTSPTAMNLIIRKDFLKETPQFFIIASKEIVDIKNTNIHTLVTEIESNSSLLAVGYKFKIFNGIKLDTELGEKYKNKDLVAYYVPWNTCAIWDYKWFKAYVVKFDEITDTNPFCPVCVTIDGECSQTPHRGMEDGLAIAKAVSKEHSLKYKLIGINHDTPLWRVNPNKILEHRQKLARKDIVLRNFMAIRGYSVEDLENSNISN